MERRTQVCGLLKGFIRICVLPRWVGTLYPDPLRRTSTNALMVWSGRLTGLVPSSSTIEGLCAILSASDTIDHGASGTYLLQEIVERHPTVRGPRIWAGRELRRGIFGVGHRGS